MSDEPRFAHKVKKPFKWINAASHNDGGAAFHARQMARIAVAKQTQAKAPTFEDYSRGFHWDNWTKVMK